MRESFLSRLGTGSKNCKGNCKAALQRNPNENWEKSRWELQTVHPGNGQTETKFELFALDIWGEILSIRFHDFHPKDVIFLLLSESRNVFPQSHIKFCMFWWILWFCECLHQSSIGFLVEICPSLNMSKKVTKAKCSFTSACMFLFVCTCLCRLHFVFLCVCVFMALVLEIFHSLQDWVSLLVTKWPTPGKVLSSNIETGSGFTNPFKVSNKS